MNNYQKRKASDMNYLQSSAKRFKHDADSLQDGDTSISSSVSPRIESREEYGLINYMLKSAYYSAKVNRRPVTRESYNIEADKEHIAQYYKPLNETLYKAQFR